MYSKTVRWADVVINGVPLESTFEHEDINEYLSSQRVNEDYERGVIIVNSRDYVPEKVVVDEAAVDREERHQQQHVPAVPRVAEDIADLVLAHALKLALVANEVEVVGAALHALLGWAAAADPRLGVLP